MNRANSEAASVTKELERTWDAMLARIRADGIPPPERGTVPVDATVDEILEIERVWRKHHAP